MQNHMVFSNRIVCAAGSGDPEFEEKRARKAPGDEGRAEGEGKSRPNGGEEGEKGRQSEAKEGKREPLGRKRRPGRTPGPARSGPVRAPGGMRGAGLRALRSPEKESFMA